ncbi:MFS transporter [Jiangella alkaliphila]|uniref:MFS transporter n=1 Tax=Jiangella alkaliphila TaxID=419479 RepID=UPI0006295784|nr:MFS transporter [Jiangella alkaliphila]
MYIALPEIGREVGFTAQSLQWVVSAYALGFGGFLLLGGRLVDRLGARRIFVAGAAWFGAASVVGLAATAPGLLVAARALQGVGAALLFPATLALVNTRFTAGAERTRALSIWGVAGASGALAGYGALAAGLGFLPQSALAMAGSWLLLPVLLRRWGIRATLAGGTAGVAVAIVAVVAAMSGDGSYWALLPGLALFGLFAGTAYPAVFAAVGSEVDAGEQGVASAVGSTAQQVGGAMGLAVLVAVANAGQGSGATADAVTDGLQRAGLAAAAVTLLAALLALGIRARSPSA